MDNFPTDFLNCLESLHNKIKRVISSLPQQVLDWSPRPGQLSLCMLVSHMAGAERYWIGEVVGREKPVRRPGSVYTATGLDSMELCERLDNSLSYCRRVLEHCDLSDLEAKRTSPRDGHEVTVGWAVEHVMQHTSGHQRDILFIRQLWVKRAYSQFNKTYVREVQVA